MKNIKTYILLSVFGLMVISMKAQNTKNFCDHLDREGPTVFTRTDDPTVGTRIPPVFDPPTSPIPEEKEKLVYWIHGYGGNNTSWTKASNISADRIHHSTSTAANPIYINDLIAFPARQIISKAPGYGTGLELSDYGISVNQQIWNESVSENQELWESKKNFCIPHSMGGLVARRAETHGSANDGFRAGGIATFGTPHAGARLANNIIMEDNTSSIEYPFETNDLKATPKLKNFLKKAISDLKAGPQKEAIQSNFLLSLLGSVIEGVVDNLTDEIVGITPSLAGPLFSRTALNLQIGNEQLEFVKNTPNLTKNVAFYGVEDKSQTMWRLFYWGVNDPNNPVTSLRSVNGEGYFDAGQDRIAIQKYEKNLAKYQAKYNDANSDYKKWKKTAQSFPCAIMPHCFIGATIKKNNARKRKEAYHRGIKWLVNSSSYWDELTGASAYQVVNQNKCFCVDGVETVEVSCDADNSNYQQCWRENTSTSTKIYKPNDGAVLKESAIDFLGAVRRIEMTGSNHFQMRNDTNTKGALMTLYTAAYSDLKFFETDKKSF